LLAGGTRKRTRRRCRAPAASSSPWKRVLGEAGDLLGPHRRPGREDEEVVGNGATVHVDRAGAGVDAFRAAGDQLDPLARRRAGERDLELLGVEPEGDVDRVRFEEEVVGVGDERDLGPLAGAEAQVEGRLEAAEAAADDDHAPGWLRGGDGRGVAHPSDPASATAPRDRCPAARLGEESPKRGPRRTGSWFTRSAFAIPWMVNARLVVSPRPCGGRIRCGLLVRLGLGPRRWPRGSPRRPPRGRRRRPRWACRRRCRGRRS
jgi:hypothetical protein